ncbi:MAG: acetylglutamate kinase [Phycisphaerales bacterium]|nr:acetylglutamate kinase [Phycisphaerales bacterium]
MLQHQIRTALDSGTRLSEFIPSKRAASRRGTILSKAPAPLLVKLGGALLDDEVCLAATVSALAQAARGSLVIVHGGGSAIDRQLTALGMTTCRRDGIRITPPEQATQIAGVLAGQVNTRLVARFLLHHVPAVGLRLSDGGLATVELLTSLGFDAGRVGRVTEGNPQLVTTLLRAGFLPVVSSVGTGDDGEVLNVNADDAAAALARIIGAHSLVFLTDVPGVLDRGGNPIAQIDGHTFERLVADHTITGGMIPKVRGALSTAHATGVPVVIASWRDPAMLSRLAAGMEVGTRVTCGPNLEVLSP